MTGLELFYLVFVLLFILAWGLKLVNLLMLGNLYGKVVSWTSLIFIIVFYGILFVVVMDSRNVFIPTVFRIISVMFLSTFLFQFIEIMLLATKKLQKHVRGQPVEDGFNQKVSFWDA